MLFFSPQQPSTLTRSTPAVLHAESSFSINLCYCSIRQQFHSEDYLLAKRQEMRVFFPTLIWDVGEMFVQNPYLLLLAFLGGWIKRYLLFWNRSVMKLIKNY